MAPSPATFDELQRAFVERVGERSPVDLTAGTMVVVPSISFLDDPAGARRRAEFVALGDPEPRGLTEKLLTRPAALQEIRTHLESVEDAFIVPFNVTELERRLAEALGIPLYGPHPDLIPLGSKSGSRRVARDAGVPLLPGAEDLFSIEEVEKAIAALRTARPDARSVVMKLNNGFSGQGNAILDLASISEPIHESPTVFCAEEESWETYIRKIAEGGAVVEQLIQDPEARSPSVQLRIFPGGGDEIISTHDQILGGPDEQVYLGCRFPAHEEYRSIIQEHARRVAALLAARGVIGSFGIDFVVVPTRHSWDAYLSEINLRLGGTTHPFLIARRVSPCTCLEPFPSTGSSGQCALRTTRPKPRTCTRGSKTSWASSRRAE